MKTVLLLCILCQWMAVVFSGDANLFVALWEEINTFTTPSFPDTAYASPPEMFIMNMPGQTIDPKF